MKRGDRSTQSANRYRRDGPIKECLGVFHLNGYWLLQMMVCIVDVALVNMGFYAGFRLRFGSVIPPANFAAYIQVVPYISIALVILFWLFGLYETYWKHTLEIVYSITLSVVFLNIVSMALTFFFRAFSFPRSVFVIAALAQMFLLGTWRIVWLTYQNKTDTKKNVMVIGANGDGYAIASKMGSLHGRNYNIIQVRETGIDKAYSDNAMEAADIICIGSEVPREEREKLISLCLNSNKEVFLVPEFYEILIHSTVIDRMDDVTVFRISGLELTLSQQLIKRAFDLLLATAVSIVALPLCPIISLLVHLSSPGPIFYIQKRTGQNGKPFNLYKFRTMVDNAEQHTGPVLATENDPRITKVGRFLRASRMDELPQIINVLKGDMSFVGPRPERPTFVKEFCATIPEYRFRLKVKPGLTGLAQVQGKYDTDPVDKLRHDLYYIRNYSPLLDLQIIFQTLYVVLIPEAARGRKVVRNSLARSKGNSLGA